MMITRCIFLLFLLGIVASSSDIDKENTTTGAADGFKNQEHVDIGGSGGYQWGWGGGGGGGVGGGSGSGKGSGGPGGGSGGGGGQGGRGGGGNSTTPGVGWGWGAGGGGRGWWKWGCGKRNGGGYQQMWNKKMAHQAKRSVSGYLIGEYAQCVGEGSRCKGMKLDCPLHCGGPCFYDCKHMCKAHCRR